MILALLSTKIARYTVLAGALLTGACASTDDLKHAQVTADQALQAAQSAGQRADAAMAAANAAAAKADAASTAANAASAKADAATQTAGAASQTANTTSDKVDRMFAKSLKK